MLTERLKQLTPSPTVSLDTKIKELQTKGIPIINLGLGEPDFATPKIISDAGIDAIESGFTHYTTVAGIPELRNAIATELQKENGLKYNSDEIIVGVGSKAILYNIFLALCNPGDEVLVATPTWNTYLEQIKLAGGIPVTVPLAPPFKLTAAELEKNLSKKTKIILLNSPSNPTGAVIEREELEQIARLAVKHNLYVISDEIYERLRYAKTPYISIASLGEEIKKRTIVVNGFSKTYAMTGWRIGFAAGPKEIISALSSLQGQITSCTSSIAQKAALAALKESKESVTEMLTEFAARREYLIREFSKLKKLSFSAPEGAFYFFVSIKKLLSEKYPTSEAWCSGLLEKEHLAVVPGEAFESPGYFRLSFAASFTDLKKGIESIKKFIV
ncbi:MAG: pyridoxal phosphate-dependent aminotransferase [Patescibacteria group bacterium]|jgi:aspartate aminotransferase